MLYYPGHTVYFRVTELKESDYLNSAKEASVRNMYASSLVCFIRYFKVLLEVFIREKSADWIVGAPDFQAGIYHGCNSSCLHHLIIYDLRWEPGFYCDQSRKFQRRGTPVQFLDEAKIGGKEQSRAGQE